ncbi:MAG TPA: hypothetical protein DIT03_12810, partial [Candidatus Accumulibacter sp.]|nr:hypothetical protein [Accumulibacter sp.]
MQPPIADSERPYLAVTDLQSPLPCQQRQFRFKTLAHFSAQSLATPRSCQLAEELLIRRRSTAQKCHHLPMASALHWHCCRVVGWQRMRLCRHWLDRRCLGVERVMARCIPLLDQRIQFVDRRVFGAGCGVSDAIRLRRNPELPQAIENRPHRQLCIAVE